MPTDSKTKLEEGFPETAILVLPPLPRTVCTQRGLVSAGLSVCVHACDHAGAHKCVLGMCVYTARPNICVCACVCMIELV